MTKRFVIGDIHGQYNALKQVLNSANFNYDNDKLIVLGDVCDGGYNTYKVVEELLKIKNLIFVLGNHDVFFIDHIKSGWSEEIWLQQGGCATLESYGAKCVEGQTWDNKSEINSTNLKIPISHHWFFHKGVYYYEEDNMLFVHGGIDPKKPIEEQTKHTLTWDREFIVDCQNGLENKWDLIFVGHTTTQKYDETVPIKMGNLIMMDCGAGWNGRLAMMDIDTKKVYLSEYVKNDR